MTAITQGLLITGLGMGLVFLMIIALWGIMAGMVALFKDKEKAEVSEAIDVVDAEPGLTVQTSQAELAAAVAVSYALAVQSTVPNQNNSQSTSWNPSTRAYSPFRQHKGW